MGLSAEQVVLYHLCNEGVEMVINVGIIHLCVVVGQKYDAEVLYEVVLCGINV
mgnify:CR=1 FL=1